MTLIDARNRQLTVTEVLELRHLPDEGLHYDEALEAPWLQNLIKDDVGAADLDLRVMSSNRVRLDIQPLGPIESRPPIQVRGTLEIWLRTPCVRCLTDVDLTLEETIELTLMPGLPETPASPPETPITTKKTKSSKTSEALEDWGEEAQVDIEDLGQGTYTPDGLDLPALLREALLLAVTMNPTCEDTPACDVRTQTLLDEANRPFREAEAAIDPRWAALRALKESEPEE